MSLKNLNIDKSWTLFLDRDGVINVHRECDYVKCWDEFQFVPGVKEAIAELNKHFGKIIVVTNQQGIGKGLYTVDELEGIHLSMMLEIILAGGNIDRIYFAPQLAEENSRMRKPNTGMAELAREEFPSIDFKKSLMVGDSITDMQFGRNAGMKTVFVGKHILNDHQKPLVDFQYQDLAQMLKDLSSQKA
jgi:histidinol-phosphate phosphatase family protein